MQKKPEIETRLFVQHSSLSIVVSFGMKFQQSCHSSLAREKEALDTHVPPYRCSVYSVGVGFAREGSRKEWGSHEPMNDETLKQEAVFEPPGPTLSQDNLWTGCFPEVSS